MPVRIAALPIPPSSGVAIWLPPQKNNPIRGVKCLYLHLSSSSFSDCGERTHVGLLQSCVLPLYIQGTTKLEVAEVVEKEGHSAHDYCCNLIDRNIHYSVGMCRRLEATCCCADTAA